MLPSMGGFLTYLKGLKPKGRIGFAFGSYGWGGQSVGLIAKEIEALGWEQPFDSVKEQYIPKEEQLSALRNLGKQTGTFQN